MHNCLIHIDIDVMLSFIFGWDSDGPVEKVPIGISQEFLEDLPIASVMW